MSTLKSSIITVLLVAAGERVYCIFVIQGIDFTPPDFSIKFEDMVGRSRLPPAQQRVAAASWKNNRHEGEFFV